MAICVGSCQHTMHITSLRIQLPSNNLGIESQVRLFWVTHGASCDANYVFCVGSDQVTHAMQIFDF